LTHCIYNFLEVAKNLTWHKVAESVESIPVSAAGLAQLTVAGKSVCVSVKAATVLICAAKCPHAGGVLANGYTDALGNIVCPLHRYKFSLATGRNTSGEGYFLKTFPVEIRPDGVFAGFEENNFLNWLK